MKVGSTPPHQLTLRADPGELQRLSGWVDVLAAGLKAGARDRFRLDLALTEAITNIITHGAPPEGPTGEITLRAETIGNRLCVTITDGGKAFDPLGALLKDRPARLEDATPGGMGLGLIRGYCDACRYERAGGQNRLSLDFLLKPDPAAQA